ncbi:hypothetical protein Tco_0790543 [Tanacetum coccineum]
MPATTAPPPATLSYLLLRPTSRPPPRRRRQKSFPAGLSGQHQKYSPPPDLLNPLHHFPSRATTTPTSPPTATSPSSSSSLRHSISTETTTTVATSQGCAWFYNHQQGCVLGCKTTGAFDLCFNKKGCGVGLGLAPRGWCVRCTSQGVGYSKKGGCFATVKVWVVGLAVVQPGDPFGYFFSAGKGAFAVVNSQGLLVCDFTKRVRSGY